MLYPPTDSHRNDTRRSCPVEVIRCATAPHDTAEQALDAIAQETNDYLAGQPTLQVNGISHHLLPVQGQRQTTGLLGGRKTEPVQQYVASIVMVVQHARSN